MDFSHSNLIPRSKRSELPLSHSGDQTALKFQSRRNIVRKLPICQTFCIDRQDENGLIKTAACKRRVDQCRSSEAPQSAPFILCSGRSYLSSAGLPRDGRKNGYLRLFIKSLIAFDSGTVFHVKTPLPAKHATNTREETCAVANLLAFKTTYLKLN